MDFFNGSRHPAIGRLSWARFLGAGSERIVAAGLALMGAEEMRAERELTSDRPDATESPFTISPRRVQIESSFAEYSRNQRNPEGSDVTTTSWNIAPINVRIGLTSASEVQILADSFFDVKTEDTTVGETERVQGFGDVTLRAKWNFWGNDGERPDALGVMPFLKLPTARDGLGNDHVEGGVIVPFAREMPGGWSLGAMTELDIVCSEFDDGYRVAWINTVTVGHAIAGNTGGFLELTSAVGEGSPAIGLNAGVTWAVDEDFQLDCGVNAGLSRAAEDWVFFTGFVKRI